MTTTVERPWVQEMVVVHRVFRRESRLMPELIRGVRPGDVDRARFLAGMIRETACFLSHLPVPARLLWHTVGRRQYAKQMRKVRGR